jgi:hypothetical protein
MLCTRSALAAEMGLELGKGHFDGIEVGAIGREEEEPCATFLEDGGGLLALVAGEVVEDDDVTRLQCRGQLRLYVRLGDLAVHRPVDEPRRGQTIAPYAATLCAIRTLVLGLDRPRNAVPLHDMTHHPQSHRVSEPERLTNRPYALPAPPAIPATNHSPRRPRRSSQQAVATRLPWRGQNAQTTRHLQSTPNTKKPAIS